MWKGERQAFQVLQDEVDPSAQYVWFHAASLGEFEQGRPLIELFRKECPQYKILLTFFSPSGYEVRKNYEGADIVCYLPLDTIANARRFLRLIRPVAAFFIKYEFWYNYICGLTARNIPFYYVSAIFRPSQYFFKPRGKWFVRQLSKASGFFVQNEESKNLLNSIGIDQVEICGDTRFDRVYAIANQEYTLDFVEEFQQNNKLIVAGSTWGPDEELLARLFSNLKGYKLIVAPHEISRKAEVMKTFEKFKTVNYTEMNDKALGAAEVLIIDTIGLLSKIYKYSHLSYIGGAFKTGLHNILEAGVFGVPLFFGPEYSHFNEAVELVARKGAFSIHSHEEMAEKIRLFEENPDYYEQTCAICRQYVQENIGACDRIYGKISDMF